MTEYDYDWLVIGSGFGGSVAALRLAEKGYKVAVLERGRRFTDDDFAETTWQLGRYYWMPKLGLKGILSLTMFRDVFVGAGCGVGGGSLGYANTLYRARPAFYGDSQWRDLADWQKELAPHYDTAERMLGVTEYDEDSAAGKLLRDYATENGFGDTYARTRVGVFLGEPGVTVNDPYFGGAGPSRTGCVRCGSCMVGCRHGAKNTLVKNYLYFAERLGVEVLPERDVVDVRPLGAGDGSDGYAVTHVRSGAILRSDRRQLTAGGVIVAAGALGTNRLLFRCKLAGSLPRISDRLGELVRTNSESILAVTAGDGAPDFSRGIAITASVYPDPDTHIEPVTYGKGADSQSLLFTLLTEAGTRRTQPLHLLLNIARHPRVALRALRIRDWSQRTVILLVMQTLDNSIRLRVKRRLPNGSVIMTTEQDPDNPNPDKVPAAYRAAEWMRQRLGGTPQAVFTEAILSIPTTAHILGGAVIGADSTRGVIDVSQRAFGYRNLLVCDGAAVPANVGVNPSLTITAMAERALAQVPPKPGATENRFSRSPMRTETEQAATHGNGRAQIAVENPATGEVIGHVDDMTAQEVGELARRARTAQPGWEAMGFGGRAHALRRMQRWLMDNADHVINTICSETGKTYEDAQIAEIAYGASAFGFWADNAPKYLADERLHSSSVFVKGKRLVLRYRPVGLVGVIGPWNYPLTNSFGDCIPALAAGNSVILKPSEITPLTSLLLAGGLAECGLPDDVFAVATGRGATGAAVLDEVDMIMFTGSTATGRKVAVRAAERLIPASLELGGKDPMIVLADANIERAANHAAYYSMFNCGQTCISIERCYVEAPIYDEFVARVTDKVRAIRQGVPTGPGSVDVGSLTFPPQVDTVERHVDEAREHGAKVLTGGHRGRTDGHWFEPTVLVDVNHDMACMREETFGPTLPIMKVADAEEAIRLANDSEYGLSAAVFSRDLKRGEAVARRVNAGAVTVNDALVNYFALELPMGGAKPGSGVGHRHGPGGIRKYCRQQSLLISRFNPRRDMHMHPYKAGRTRLLGQLLRALNKGAL